MSILKTYGQRIVIPALYVDDIDILGRDPILLKR